MLENHIYLVNNFIFYQNTTQLKIKKILKKYIYYIKSKYIITYLPEYQPTF